jgi:hypothetical protein
MREKGVIGVIMDPHGVSCINDIVYTEKYREKSRENEKRNSENRSMSTIQLKSLTT